MKDLGLILMALVIVWVVLSWASTPSQVLAEQKKAQAAQTQVSDLKTSTAILIQHQPTPRPCHTGSTDFYPPATC